MDQCCLQEKKNTFKYLKKCSFNLNNLIKYDNISYCFHIILNKCLQISVPE